jgi:hypothetical protein
LCEIPFAFFFLKKLKTYSSSPDGGGISDLEKQGFFCRSFYLSGIQRTAGRIVASKSAALKTTFHY